MVRGRYICCSLCLMLQKVLVYLLGAVNSTFMCSNGELFIALGSSIQSIYGSSICLEFGTFGLGLQLSVETGFTVVLFVSAVHFAPYLTGLGSMMLI